ncbi:NDMA-dependent alcohol dehydrogenase [Conexibacter sp. CPCC 206217]|uniref:NDMA-dependent alcohol dehydrogenase n=1 Tax=Conexibacter sp. CPCC 206217 TaxID=3064574 RepID=UPI00271914E8|nr:NDMA-dependent alcohol dehydrogenase [Conexibacter sp. CPCC 206217]MDO8212428.1 NDMA-dependent alcohol dehydrogenase [Conexibacter sp. CPCC 206217]
MKTKAAVIRGVGQDWEVIEADLDAPKANEVLIRFVAAGLCHSDEHIRHGDLDVRFPIVGGHEGAGVIEQVGEGVSRVRVGDHVICSFLPVCGHCRFCARGKSYLCDLGATILEGSMPDGTFRFHADGEDFGALDLLGTFSQYAVIREDSCIVIDKDLPLDVVVLLGCGVPTGWGSAVKAGEVQPGDTTVIYGTGGIGNYAVQGAAYAGAQNIVAVDPIPFKREAAGRFGATHVAATAEEAQQIVHEITHGVGADQSIITMDVLREEVVSSAFSVLAKGGTAVVTSVADAELRNIHVHGFELTLFNKRIQGSLYGSGNPFEEIPRLVGLYRAGKLQLDETITRRYRLDEVNQGYQDLLDGKNVRGVIIHEH